MAQVLVTGSAGRIGGAAYQALLARGHTVRGFDLVRPQQTPHAVIGDLAHFDQVREALSRHGHGCPLRCNTRR